jgi:hypothetical protein
MFGLLLPSPLSRMLNESVAAPASCPPVVANRLTSSHFEYIKPLLYIEKCEQAPRFAHIRQHLEAEIESLKKAGILESASVGGSEKRGNHVNSRQAEKGKKPANTEGEALPEKNK